jgi:hypothetical protein
MNAEQAVLIENADNTMRSRFNSPSEALQQFREDCEYDPEGESTVDQLIDYKNALEDFAYEILDQLSREQEATRLRNE